MQLSYLVTPIKFFHRKTGKEDAQATQVGDGEVDLSAERDGLLVLILHHRW